MVCGLWVTRILSASWACDLAWGLLPLVSNGTYTCLAFNYYPMLSASLSQFWSYRCVFPSCA
jgi:hypothetical protein